MTGLVSGLFGGDKAAKRQERALRKQEAALEATEAGQRRLREGGRGLLAFLDETPLGGGLLSQVARRFGGLS